MVADYRDTVARARTIEAELPPQYHDAYFQLVLDPAEASENVLEMNVLAAKNHAYAVQGRVSTNDLAAQVRTLFARDAEFTHEYHTLNNGKWDHMMDQTHIGYTFWNEPAANIMPAVSEIQVAPSGRLGVSGGLPGPRGGLVFDVHTSTPQVVDVYNMGATPFTYTATTSAPWIHLSTTEGEVAKDAKLTVSKDTQLTVSIDWPSLPAGDQAGTITFAQVGSEINRVVRLRVDHPSSPALDSIRGFVEDNGVVSIEAEHFASRTSGGAATWERLPGYGETLSAMTVFPALANSATSPTTCLNYEVYLFGSGKEDLQAILAPTAAFMPGHGLRYSVALDAQPPVIVDAWADYKQKDWEQAVSDGVHKVNTPLEVDRAGAHTLHFCMVDPGVVLEKLVISRGKQIPFYLGPPESTHR